MKKRALVVFTLILGTYFSLMVSAFSGSGSGTVASPYQITNWSQLQEIRNNLSAHYKLMNGLNSSTEGYSTIASSSANSGAGFIPIGNSTARFTGSFNGTDKTISDLVINRSGTSYVGLFGGVNYTNITDLDLLNASIVGSQYTGGIIGNSGSMLFLLDVHFQGTINGSGSSYLGGLVGYVDGSASTIGNSSANSSIISGFRAGGLIGYGTGINITTSRAYTTMSSISGDYNGGLAGDIAGAIKIFRSLAIVNITGAIEESGGFVGRMTAGTMIITESYSQGNLTNTGNGNNVGGFIGHMNEHTGTQFVGDSYANVDIGLNTTNGARGGFVGQKSGNGQRTINNTYSRGRILGNMSLTNFGAFAGGDADTNANLAIASSYWDRNITSGVSASEGNNATGRTTEQMKNSGNYTGWNFDSTWSINASRNGGYPYLSWQKFDGERYDDGDVVEQQNNENNSTNNSTNEENSTQASSNSDGNSGSGGASFNSQKRSPDGSINLFFRIRTSKEGTAKIDSSWMQSISIYTKNPMFGTIKISELNDIPQDCVLNYSDYKLYKTIKIDHDFNNSNLEIVKLDFVIENNWISENEISSVQFIKCLPNGQEHLKTDLISKNSSVSNYKVTSENGFSTWALIGITEEKAQTQESENRNYKIEKNNIILLIVLLLVIFLIILLITLRRKK